MKKTKEGLFDYRYCNFGFDVGGHTWYLMLHLHLFDWRLDWFTEDRDAVGFGFWFGPLYFDFAFNGKWEYPDEQATSSK